MKHRVVTEEELLTDLGLDPEHIIAWIYTEQEGAYQLGPMQEGLGWVSEENVCRMAETNLEHIFFLTWSVSTTVSERL